MSHLQICQVFPQSPEGWEGQRVALGSPDRPHNAASSREAILPAPPAEGTKAAGSLFYEGCNLIHNGGDFTA